MIDDPDKTNRLVEALEASLPVETRLPASLIQTLSKRSPDLAIPARCNVVSVFYMGDEGGIMRFGHRRARYPSGAPGLHHPPNLRTKSTAVQPNQRLSAPSHQEALSNRQAATIDGRLKNRR
ncbi:hypothetical protein O7A70_32890 [Mesorhizobium sp. Cs1299R1N1]|uniref:hypothetical protein n=1 Tax=Mesorhizobium sp. Cs1299R1N1 TaxID=3015172 RepID=UPI00301D465F